VVKVQIHILIDEFSDGPMDCFISVALTWCGRGYAGEGRGSQREWHLYSKTAFDAEPVLPDDRSILRAADASTGAEWTSSWPAPGQLRHAGHG